MFILASFLAALFLMPILKFLAFIADFSLGWGASYAISVIFAYVVMIIRAPRRG